MNRLTRSQSLSFVIRHSSVRGSILISTLVFTFVFLIMGMSLLGLLQQRSQLSKLRRAQLTALQIAEAGANYYRWHLAHAPTDYADGTGATGCTPCGPYVHNYSDPSGGVIARSAGASHKT